MLFSLFAIIITEQLTSSVTWPIDLSNVASGLLYVVHCHHASVLHRYGDVAPQRYWGHDFDLLGLRDVIGHVTIRLTVGHFLWVVHGDHASIWHRYWDMASLMLDGHDRTDAQIILICSRTDNECWANTGGQIYGRCESDKFEQTVPDSSSGDRKSSVADGKQSGAADNQWQRRAGTYSHWRALTSANGRFEGNG